MSLPLPPPPPIEVTQSLKKNTKKKISKVPISELDISEDEYKDEYENKFEIEILKQIQKNIENINKLIKGDIKKLYPINFSEPLSDELKKAFEDIYICIYHYYEGLIKYYTRTERKGKYTIKCNEIMDFLFYIIESFRNPDILQTINEEWYITPKKTESQPAIRRSNTSPLRKILQIVYDISENINLSNILFIKLIEETIKTYNFLINEQNIIELKELDRIYGKRILEKYRLFKEEHFSFDEYGNLIIAQDKEFVRQYENEEEEQKEEQKKEQKEKQAIENINPFAKGVAANIQDVSVLEKCQEEIKKLKRELQELKEKNSQNVNIVSPSSSKGGKISLLHLFASKMHKVGQHSRSKTPTRRVFSMRNGVISKKRDTYKRNKKTKKSKKRRYAKKID